MRGDISKWEVYVNWKDFARICEVYIVRYCEGEWTEYITKMDGDKTEVKKVKPHEPIQPTMIFYHPLANQILQAFADTCEKHGFRPEGKPVLENELTASKYHLEDMRKLVFKGE